MHSYKCNSLDVETFITLGRLRILSGMKRRVFYVSQYEEQRTIVNTIVENSDLVLDVVCNGGENHGTSTDGNQGKGS